MGSHAVASGALDHTGPDTRPQGHRLGATLPLELPSGEYRIHVDRAGVQPGVPVARTPRLDRGDLLRGLVMVILALDHLRACFTTLPALPVVRDLKARSRAWWPSYL